MATQGRQHETTAQPAFTVPGMKLRDGSDMAIILQRRLEALIDLGLTLKHIHWNVVGPFFIGVHSMLDTQVDGVAAMIDQTAERIATLGIAPNGLAGNLIKQRAWDDYSLTRGLVAEHLGALDLVYTGIIEDHRKSMVKATDLDPVSEDMLIQHCASLEQYHWFIRAHLESAAGVLSTRGTQTEKQAARKAS